jgi:hypothetical protein
MKLIATIVMGDISKNLPKQVGIDVLGRLSTDKDSRHKSILLEIKEREIAIPEIQNLVIEIIGKKVKSPFRISRLEFLNWEILTEE